MSVLVSVATLLLGVVVVLLITVATGWFVAQEFAFMTVDRSRLAAAAAGVTAAPPARSASPAGPRSCSRARNSASP